MNELNFLPKLVQFFRCTVFITLFLYSNHLFAEGSRDLYPSGASGYRAFLRSNTSATANYPFASRGTHFVYAKVGERVTLASSALGRGSSAIRLYDPNGSVVMNVTDATGQIPNRTAELAGPQLPGQTGGDRYTPTYYTVPAGSAGIYRVEFVPPSATSGAVTTILANNNWTQSSSGDVITAWDVSVVNTAGTGFIQGRVYANLFNFNTGTNSPGTDGFYGKLYALTKDGYIYKVNSNGMNGMLYTFFVNNNGFIDADGLPIYKSLNGASPAFLAGKVHDPSTADTSNQITHKMFYNLPNTDMPSSSVGAVPGGTTWLKNPVVDPVVTNVTVEGVEGTPQQIGVLKGGYIKFTSNVQGTYHIEVSGSGFVTRVLTGTAVAGNNKVYWDGKDGNGVTVTVGSASAAVDMTIYVQGGEVHFPYMDVEFNKNGMILELLNHNDLAQVVSDIVYWNDTDITATSNGSSPNPINNSHLPPVNSNGISSNVNGHIWGVNSTSNSGTFGDNRSIDTWSFRKGEQVTVNSAGLLKSADLMVSSLTPNKTTAIQGEQVAYTVKVKNDGPSDVPGAKFTFKTPAGFTPQNTQFIGNGCGTESVAMSYDSATNTYTSELNLPSGCEITYIVTVVVNNSVVSGTQSFQGAILRVNDITDPDATNPDINVMPTDAQAECSNNGLGGTCNNIKTNLDLMVPCYNPAYTGQAGADTKFGITLLQRAGNDGDGNTSNDWPMLRKSAHMVLESNTKGFVITRMTTSEISLISNPVEGMMVYDTVAKCLKINTTGTSSGWSCFSIPSCP
ncbi:hypothetical protein PFY12_06945 [Chryseobacterium camelliae]|uniref:DUF11 domain-containing protein n=1 Tax=Chryseobacterium camelliae TaxID=1265445 RepID=A0ABY7QRA3_9FLAO|nr:hypothetical protein [Chryseobacterium camelliae]WBV61854.1 hypothetical protein PFY12_06945 [Chryseobacterium camelliae]